MKKILATVCLILTSVLAFSQDKTLSLNLRQILFRDFADTVEKKIPVKFYYSEKWVDTFRVNINSQKESLEKILDKSVVRNGLSFIITDENKIIFSKGYSIKTSFRKEYLEYIRTKTAEKDTTAYNLPAVQQDQQLINEEYKVFRIGNPSAVSGEGNAIVSGIIRNHENGNALPGVVVYVAKLRVGAITNSTGYYSLELPRGQYQVEYRMVGLRQTVRNVLVYSSGNLDVDMTESTNQLNEVVVSANRENQIQNVRIGVEKIDVKMLKQIPLGMGEVDLFKSSLMLPGVTSVGEASGGYNIRGGSADQNLILLDGAPVINPNHFFGFFSSFNSDMISGVTLYKSGIPAKFGGRVSSVMDISLREGNMQKVNVSGGLSPLTGRLMVEGPIVKNKSSFIISARTTYSDWILRMMKDVRLKKSSAGFYDLQGVFTLNQDPKNSFSLSGYLSSDNFDYYRENAIDYNNIAGTLRWKHIYSPRLSSQVSAIMSSYNYTDDSKQDSSSYSSLVYNFNQKIIRADFDYLFSDRHKMEFGIEASSYTLAPGTLKPIGIFSDVLPAKLEKERALEPSIYFNDEFEITPRLTITGGIRLTFFTNYGPSTNFVYKNDSPRSVDNITDTVYYGSGKIVKMYTGPELRISSRYVITPDLSVKAGVQRTYQYIHMISNTTSITPTDIWKLSDNYIRPTMGDQVSLGLYRNFNVKALEASVEVYYKRLQDILDYKGGAELLMNDHLETDIINGTGKAYGIELMLKKDLGSLTGWISYTYSRVLHKVDGRFEQEKINEGSYFPADYDKPNDLKAVANFKVTRRFNFTTNFVYNTGRPITYPVAYYDFLNVNRLFYSERNEFRIPDYMRLDLAATINGNLRAKKLNHSSFTFTAYNILGRRNPYSIFFKIEDGAVKGYRMSIFGQPIFMFSYNFRILGNASTDF